MKVEMEFPRDAVTWRGELQNCSTWFILIKSPRGNYLSHRVKGQWIYPYPPPILSPTMTTNWNILENVLCLLNYFKSFFYCSIGSYFLWKTLYWWKTLSECLSFQRLKGKKAMTTRPFLLIPAVSNITVVLQMIRELPLRSLRGVHYAHRTGQWMGTFFLHLTKWPSGTHPLPPSTAPASPQQ